MTPFRQALEHYRAFLRAAETSGREALDLLVAALRPVLPDLNASLGWAEAGIDTLCFWSKSHHVGTRGSPWQDDRRELVEVLSEVLEDAGIDVPIDTPEGIFLTEREAQQIRDAVRTLLGVDSNQHV